MGAPAIRDWAADIFAHQRGEALSPVLGNVVLDKRAVRDSIAHDRPNQRRVAAFAAVKNVLEKGALIATAHHAYAWRQLLCECAGIAGWQRPYRDGIGQARYQ